MRLVIIRHGQSIWNEMNIFTGWRDVDLSELGITEAKNAGTTLLEHNLHFDKIYTSYLKRAIHTADIVLDQMDAVYLPVVKAWQLNERHYGALQGLNKKDVADQYGDEQVRLWRRSYDLIPPLLEEGSTHDPHLLPMYRNVDPNLLPLGESLELTVHRVIPYFNKVIKKDMKNGERLLIVAHGNSIRALLKELNPYSDEEIVKLEIPTGSPLVLDFDEDFNLIRTSYL